MARSDHVLILASGKGERMGGPKALMDAVGEPWRRVQAARIAHTGLEATWVVSQPVREAIYKEYDAPLNLVTGDSDEPMFESIVQGVRSMAYDPPRGAFILPVDVPVPDKGVFESLSRGSHVTIPTHERTRGHPLYLPWIWVESNLLMGSPAERRLDALTRTIAREVEVEDANVVTNINTPDDLDQWLAGQGELA